MTPTRSAAPASQSRNDDTSNTDDSTMMTTTITRQGRAASPKDAHPMRARLCYSYPKPKGPMLETSKNTRLQAPPEAGFCHVLNSSVTGFPVSAWLWADGAGREAVRTACSVFRTSAHPLPVERPRVVPESQHGVLTMTQAVTLARTAAPIIPASPAAAPIRPQADTTDRDTIALHVQAENALSMALAMLRNPTGTAADLERATARVCRAATMLKRLSAAQVKEVAA